MPRPAQILICDDDSLIHLAVKQALKGQFECRSAYNSDEALAILRNHPVDLLLLDIQIRTPDEGLRAIARFREFDPELNIVMMSGVTDYKAVRESMRLGAADYVVKDLEQNDLSLVIERALERKQLRQRNEQQGLELKKQQKQHLLIGESAAIRSLRKTLDRIRNSPANVVITGETGTGKEVVARHLRRTLTDGSLAPFAAVDSATIQSSTAESLLFGHEKGAFTGAERATKGIFEEADGGIVYFDEIANMPLDIQAKLLRVLQEKEVVRLGSSKVIQLDFRVVCASNKDLEGMAKAGQFKDDLLQRLNVIPIALPPLRERTEDIPTLAEHFIAKQGRAFRISPDALELLQHYSWPGNVRELGNLIAYLTAMTDGDTIEAADLPPKFRDAAKASRAKTAPDLCEASQSDFYARVAAFEKTVLSEEYSRHAGNVSRMALQLGMDRSHLHTKLKEHGIHVARGQK